MSAPTKAGLGVIDPAVLSRSNHTGSQSINTVTGLQAALARFTDWVAYTPIFTAFGTVTEVNVFSRRIGDTLQLRGSFVPGTPATSEARMSLGFGGVDGGLAIDAAKVPRLQVCGFMTRNVNTFNHYFLLADSGLAYLNFALQSDTVNSGSKANGNSIVASGNRLNIIAEVPISGWGA